MSEHGASSTQPAPVDSAAELVQILDGYLADLQAGRAPDRAALLAAHPLLAAELEQCLSGLERIQRAGRAGGAPSQLGDFRIVRELGRGGMGVVYEAEQLSVKRRVALKVLRLGAASTEEALSRFKREAETVAGLHHTNIVPLFAFGEEAGVPYFAMQLIDGRSLAPLAAEGPLDPREVARWGLQAAEALAHAHRRGVVHRDVKPSNLLLDKEGTVWLTDFGLARRTDELTLTVTGALLGTPRYMSPEQAARQPVDQRSDVYSLGATLYQLAAGRPPFEGDSPHAVLLQILHAEPAAPRQLRPTLPRDLETIILKCLNKEAAQRYPSAEELAADLRAFREGRAIRARRPRVVERLRRWAKKNRRSVVLAGVTAVLSMAAALAGAVSWIGHRDQLRERAERDRLARLGRVIVRTDDQGLTGEVLDESGQVVVNAVALPTREPLGLEPGNYRLRLRGPWPQTETVPFAVPEGGSREVKVAWTGRVVLTTDGPPLVGQVIDDRKRQVVPAFPVPADEPLVLPAGTYSLRLRGPWRPVHTLPLVAERGKQVALKVSLLGKVQITTKGPPLQVEVLDEKDQQVVPPFTAPMQQPLSLPAASYRVRFTQKEFFSETAQLLLDREASLSFQVELGERGLGLSLPVEGRLDHVGGLAGYGGFFEVVSLGRRPTILQGTRQGLRRLDAATGKEVWHSSLEATPSMKEMGEYKWYQILGCRFWHVGDNEPGPNRARLVRPLPDLDGDGTPDLVWASRRTSYGRVRFDRVWADRPRASLLAVSGKTGKVLWWHRAGPELPPDIDPAKVTSFVGDFAGAVVGEPAVADVDGDGMPDLIATFQFKGGGVYLGEGDKRVVKGQINVAAVSGRTGKRLWQISLDGSEKRDDNIEREWRQLLAHSAEVGRVGDEPVVKLAVGRKLAVLRLKDGKPLWPVRDLGYFAVGRPHFIEAKGPAALLMRAPFLHKGKPVPPPSPEDNALTRRGSALSRPVTLAAVSLRTGEVLWSKPLGVHWPRPTRNNQGSRQVPRVMMPPPEWPIVADLGAGKPEVIVPAGDGVAKEGWIGVEVLDAVSGVTRWSRRLGRLAWRSPEDAENARRHWLGLRLTVGPDLDRDGRREVFVAARLTENQGFTAALSGGDGRVLWRSTPGREEHALPGSGISLLRWWQTGSDGHPQLVIPCQPTYGPGTPVANATLYVLEPSTGRARHIVPDFGDPRVADLDGDGVPDLYAFRTDRKEEVGAFESDTRGHVAVLRGTHPEVWRRFGTARPAADFDADGSADVFLQHFDIRGRVNWWLSDGPREIKAFSGRTGELLWRSGVLTAHELLPLKADLDGDGHPDTLTTTPDGSPAVAALSGKTGKTLWSLTRWPDGKREAIRFELLGCFKVDGRPPLVAGTCFVDGGPRLVALDGRTGRLKWHIRGSFAEGTRVAVTDLDGDGVGDLLFWSFNLLRAVSGRDGKILWAWTSPQRMEQPSARLHGIFRPPSPAVGNLGDGTVVLAPDEQYAPQRGRHGVVVLGGKDGTVKARWQGTEFNPGRVLASSPWGWRQPMPRLVRLGGRVGICAAVLEGKDRPGWQLVLLEQRGGKLEVRQRRKLTQPLLGNGGFLHFWVYDRGGSDGVLVGEQGKLLALRNGVTEMAWQGPPLANVADLLDREAGSLVVRVGGTVLGLEGRTGRVLWRCAGPGKFAGLLKESKPGALPRVLFELNQTTICRIPLKVAAP